MKNTTLGELKKRGIPERFRSVKDEIRENLIAKLKRNEDLFPGIVGYEETVIPGIINALLSRHNLILLGLRGQAKSRILRALTSLLDDEIPEIEGSEIHDDPFFPISEVSRRRLEEEGDDLPITFLKREERYVEKLATPDVTIADMIGDLDPIKAARHGRQLSALENMHFGLLPRAHRGIFAINELPDLAPKIQVALFNIMQEGDVQIKGFPVRLPLDVLLVFSANPEDYTARGKIITPLKDRIGAEIKTHYPRKLEHGIRITSQEAWIDRDSQLPRAIPEFVSEIVELIAFTGRSNKQVDRRSGVSQRLPISCLETAVSNAERRALNQGESQVVVRVADVYASLTAVTGKLELEYEGELKGPEKIARELIQLAVREAFERRFQEQDFERIVQWFELGGEIKTTDQTGASEYYEAIQAIQGVEETLKELGVSSGQRLEEAVAWIEFILEGLCARKKLSRTEERGYFKDTATVEETIYGKVEGNRESFN